MSNFSTRSAGTHKVPERIALVLELVPHGPIQFSVLLLPHWVLKIILR
jgi:hypothetical protein